ncbi:MAG: hypothetical protein VZR36_06420 [Prevotella sp.]|nr:hypothetical protein [Prevotella sp.]
MKKTLILISALSLLLGASSCDNSILNHKGAVIVGKECDEHYRTYRLVYRYKNSKGYYAIDNVYVVKYEYDSYNIGDTVK